jgi:hypothetical protein
VTGSSSSAHVNGDHIDQQPAALQPGGKICLTCGIDVSPKWYPINQVQERELTNGHYGTLGAEAQKFVEQRSFQCHKCRKAKRQPKPHSPRVKEASPQPEPVRLPPQVASRAASPPAPSAETGHSGRGPFTWSPPLQAGPFVAPHPPQAAPLTAPAATAVAASVAAPVAPPIQPPSVAPPLPPTVAPRVSPAQTHPYPSPTVPYGGDWHRPHSQHGPPPAHPHREINGGPPASLPANPGPALAAPNHLRPPPISNLAHPAQPPPMSNGPVAQPPFVNGLPSSPPRRMSGPPALQNGGPFPHSYHHAAHPPPPQHLANGGPPPRAPEHPFSAGILGHRSPFSTPHGSPPASRDGIPVTREPSNPPPPREARPASGASVSPSLRNLVS